MKRWIPLLLAAATIAAATTGCKEEYTTYSDAEYVMFADTLSINYVTENQEYFEVPLAATTSADYDRTLAVEVVDKGSNAIEGRHYRLLSNTVTIPAGQRAASVRVRGNFENMEAADSLGFILRLVMPQQLKWSLYDDRTKVVMRKSCTFHIEDFTGWCVLTSGFLQQYPGIENKTYQRLVKTERHPTEENTIIVRDWMFTGYDITMRFHPDDASKPWVTMDKDQVLSDELRVFGQTHGDNKILVTHSPINESYFDACQKFIMLWTKMYVYELGKPIVDPDTGIDKSLVGHYPNVMEWISDEEAERLQREEGM